MGTSNTPQDSPASPAAQPASAAESAASQPEKIETSASDAKPEIFATAQKPNSSAAAPTAAGLSRFALLAASIALAAAIGSFAGSLAASGVTRLLPGPETTSTADASRSAQQLSARVATDYSTLKSNVDSLSRIVNTQFTKLGERLERAERAQAEPAAKLGKIAEALDRVEKQGAAAPEITGSITGAPRAAEAKPAEKTLEGWVLHEVRRGRAILESRDGGLFEVAAGGFLPGVGRVQEIKRQDGRWVVVTSRGQITSFH